MENEFIEKNETKKGFLTKIPDIVYFVLTIVLLPTVIGAIIVLWIFVVGKRNVIGGYEGQKANFGRYYSVMDHNSDIGISLDDDRYYSVMDHNSNIGIDYVGAGESSYMTLDLMPNSTDL